MTIAGGCITSSDGTTLELSDVTETSCSFDVNGIGFDGRLEGPEKLVWSDGAVWKRRQGLAGLIPAPAADDGGDEVRDEALEAQLRSLEREEPEDAGDEEPPRLLPAAASSSASASGRIEVLARHATEDRQVRVLLPARAKFKHVKKALARGPNGAVGSMLLSYKLGARYRACKDEQAVQDVRHVLVSSADFGAFGSGAEVALSDGEVSAEEDPLPEPVVEEEEPEGEGTSSPSQAPPVVRTRGGPQLTLEHAKMLQRELLKGYKEFKFQQRLDSLDRIYGAFPDSMEFQQERQELLLSVQKQILPRFGFEGNIDGVYRMIGTMGAFLEDPEFTKLAKEINKTLGIRSPVATWGKLTQDCSSISTREDAERKTKKVDMRRLVPPSADGEGPKSLLPAVPPYVKAAQPAAAKAEPAAAARAGGGASPAQKKGSEAPVEVAAKAGVLDFESYPAGRVKPFKLFVAGSWNDYAPVEMHWQRGLFVSAVTIGNEGIESFQLLKNGKWNAAIYPSAPDASLLEEHEICGPNADGHGKNWTIGKYSEEGAEPGKQFAIIAALDKQATVRLVHWQPM